LLPYLEQQAVYEQVDRNQVLSHVSNTAACETVIVNFLCPSDIVDPTFMLYQEHALSVSQTPIIKLPTASYVGVFGTLEADDSIPAPPGDGTFLESVPVSFRQLQRGLTH
ncbi:MAG TPA: hypothetical protein DIT97_14115, partial [Gimesia maris]|nr:hypothetical protein [Gimesia maris]